MNGLFIECPLLKEYKTDEGAFGKFKGRLYCRMNISGAGALEFNDDILKGLQLSKGNRLLCVRGSNIAFVMGVKGPVIERGNNYKGEIKLY